MSNKGNSGKYRAEWSSPLGRRPQAEIEHECLVHAMRRIGEQIAPNKVYLMTVLSRVEPRNQRPWDSYIVSILAQEILSDDPPPISNTNLDEGIGRSEV